MPRSSPSTEQARRFVAGLVIVVALGIAAALALPLPGQKTDTVLVDDAAGLMDEEQRAHVAEYHGFLLEDHDIDYRVVTLEDSGDISLFAVERFEERGVGQASQTGRGLMLVIDASRDSSTASSRSRSVMFLTTRGVDGCIESGHFLSVMTEPSGW